MNEIVDRVLLVLARSGMGCVSGAFAQSSDACAYKVCRCRVVARDAIAAMREPTEAMTDAPFALPHLQGLLSKANELDAKLIWPEDAWQAMIDAALKET